MAKLACRQSPAVPKINFLSVALTKDTLYKGIQDELMMTFIRAAYQIVDPLSTVALVLVTT